MDPKVRAQIGLIIVAFAIVFTWGAVLSASYISPPSFSAETLTAASEAVGAPQFTAGSPTFTVVLLFGLLLIIGFIMILRSAHTPQDTPPQP